MYINPNSVHSPIINNHWDNLRMTDGEYATKFAKHYRFRNLNGDYSLLDDYYCLKSEVKINTDIDFLFFLYMRAEHRNKTIENYPTPQEIAEEMLRSGYATYFNENINSGITTSDDVAIKSFLNPNP